MIYFCFFRAFLNIKNCFILPFACMNYLSTGAIYSKEYNKQKIKKCNDIFNVFISPFKSFLLVIFRLKCLFKLSIKIIKTWRKSAFKGISVINQVLFEPLIRKYILDKRWRKLMIIKCISKGFLRHLYYYSDLCVLVINSKEYLRQKMKKCTDLFNAFLCLFKAFLLVIFILN